VVSRTGHSIPSSFYRYIKRGPDRGGRYTAARIAPPTLALGPAASANAAVIDLAMAAALPP
jgi:hypothetical protein